MADTINTNGNSVMIMTFADGGIVNVDYVEGSTSVTIAGRFEGGVNSLYSGVDQEAANTAIAGYMTENVQP